MHPNQNIKVNDWYMKRNLTIWKAADFKCMNIPADENQFGPIKTCWETKGLK